MTITEIRTATNQTKTAARDAWAWAHLLGTARVRSNEQRGGRHRDRGAVRNQLGDLRGAFCELCLYEIVQNCKANTGAITYIRNHIFNPLGGASERGPDLLFQDEETQRLTGVDVKSFDCAYNKKFFAINAEKHESLRGQCEYYLCFLVAPFGKEFAVTQLVPFADVDKWPIGRLGNYNDPSRNLPIEEFTNTYLSFSISLETLRTNLYPEDQIQSLWRNEEIIGRLAEHFPALRDHIAANGYLD